MTTNELRQIFQAPYSRQKWSHILHFLSESKNLLRLRLDPIKIPFDSNEADRLISSFYELGTLKTSDDEEFPIFEVLLNDKVQIGHNKVTVNNFVKKYIIKDSIRGALVTFSYENSNRKEWRFSFISKNTASDYFAEAESLETHPKKYTYVFGTEESHSTAIQRFFSLHQSNLEVKDFFNAFEVEALNKEFFDGYKNIYEDFVEYITGKRFVKEKGKWVEKEKHLPDPQYCFPFKEDDKYVRDYVKKLLGRLVFLHFLQKKGWLNNDVNYLKNLFEKSDKTTFLEEVLKPLFFGVLNTKLQERKALFESEGWNLSLLEEWEQIPYLNGGLFEKDTIDQEIICFSKDLFENTFHFFSEYNFTIDENDPEDTQIGIDPEMLGKIFENLLEDNKDKGAFYTPKEIVQYMCRESLIAYLTGKYEDEETNIRTLVEQYTSPWNDATSKAVLECLKEIKICDPAIGSGAFPMGMLNELYKCRLALGEEKSVKIKKDIIQNNIYGVDIEKGAVDIARLRFWLALVVDETIPDPLPNLDFKIMQGNSLLESYQGIDLSALDKGDIIKNPNDKDSIDYGDNFKTSHQQPLLNKTQKEQIQQLISDYFTLTEDKNLKRKEINDLIEEKIRAKIYKEKLEVRGSIDYFFDKYNLNSEEDLEDKLQKGILTSKGTEYKAYITNKRRLSELNIIENELISFQTKIERPYFLWHTYFKDVFDKGGFDIVIGNPPYIKEYENKDAFNGFRESPYYKGKMDIWYGFACKGIDYLNTNGIICFIAQNNWITSTGASILRNKILEETELNIFVDFVDYNVFESASIQTMIFICQKVEKIREEYLTKVSILKNKNITKSELVDFLNFNLKIDYGTKEIFKLKPKNYIDKTIHFNQSNIENILQKIQEKGTFKLNDDEVAQGIVSPQDFVNESSAKTLGGNVKKGDGIFVVSDKELTDLKLSEKEYELIKPYYTSEELDRYYTNKKNSYWIIYTNSDFKSVKKIESFPNIKKHLDKFSEVITSDNKPYGLHRSRDEKFFINEKILSLRKCKEPIFTYTDFDCYVSQTYFIIQTNRLNLKYLTIYLNSKIVRFWLKFRGKMQGENYQIDKDPLLNIPIVISEKEEDIVKLSENITINENNINSLFYKAFNLTENEIQIIENHL